MYKRCPTSTLHPGLVLQGNLRPYLIFPLPHQGSLTHHLHIPYQSQPSSSVSKSAVLLFELYSQLVLKNKNPFVVTHKLTTVIMAEAEMSSSSRRILAVSLENETAVLSKLVKGWCLLFLFCHFICQVGISYHAHHN